MQTPEITFAALTDVGRKREHNEDNFLVDKKLSFFVVCDGMGGHAAGEVASAIAVRTLHDELKKEVEMLEDYCEDKQGADRVNQKDILNMLEFAANRASRAVHEAAQADASKRGMGTTLVAVLFLRSQAFIVHVGDSRAYLLRNGVLEQLTDDHNVHNELMRRKKLTKAEILRLAPKNAITRAVGVYESCEPDTLVMDVVSGDRFLLCSDGLSEYFEGPHGAPEQLASLLESPDAEQTTRELIEVANSKGGKDNITAVVVTVGDLGEEDQTRAARLELKKTVLGDLPFFNTLDDRELLRVLQATKELEFQDGDRIITEGERGDSLYILLKGQVRVVRAAATLKTLYAGEHFGEMALIRSQPRSASILAEGPTELLCIHRGDFFEILRSQPRLAVKLLWQFTGVLADRLADTNRDLGVAREELAEEIDPDDVTEELFGWDPEDERETIRVPAPASGPPQSRRFGASAPPAEPPTPLHETAQPRTPETGKKV